ncbi:hypothetical protein Tco_0804637 [Tanacetum coccineum]|uniref:Uncharacterized protein n=1 Tax=Tanacetum coccineum TaxID=301880 RepID=A0ABQ5A4V2_9ASTR
MDSMDVLTLDLLVSTLKEILATEHQLHLPQPPPLVGVPSKENLNKYCDYHNEKGHNTSDCFYLKRQLEIALDSDKLNHLVKDVREKEKGRQKGNGPQKGKVINMGAQGDREAEVFQVSNNDNLQLAQDGCRGKQPEEKTKPDCLVKEQKRKYQTGWKIKTGDVLDFVIMWSTLQCTGSMKVARVMSFMEETTRRFIHLRWNLDGNVDHVVGFTESKNSDLIYYHAALCSGFRYLKLPRAGVVMENVTDVPGSFDEDGAVPHKAGGALVVGREVSDLATDGHYRMELFTDGHSSLPTSRIPPFYIILLLATLCHEKLLLTKHSYLPF